MAVLARPFIVGENDLINYHILQTPLGHHNMNDNQTHQHILTNEKLKDNTKTPYFCCTCREKVHIPIQRKPDHDSFTFKLTFLTSFLNYQH